MFSLKSPPKNFHHVPLSSSFVFHDDPVMNDWMNDNIDNLYKLWHPEKEVDNYYQRVYQKDLIRLLKSQYVVILIPKEKRATRYNSTTPVQVIPYGYKSNTFYGCFHSCGGTFSENVGYNLDPKYLDRVLDG